jgi:lysophospholipase L1-like esterase
MTKTTVTQLFFAVLAFAFVAPSAEAAGGAPAGFRKGARILFQGDSITDGGRGPIDDLNHNMGHGYAYILAADFGAHSPERNLTFFNRGAAGNKIPDLLARWPNDTIALKPDVLSILIGINDVWHNLDAGKKVPVEEFEQAYDKLLADTVAALPGIKIVLCEPFMLPGTRTKARLSEWLDALGKIQQIVAKLGAKYKAPVVHFQKMFDDACDKAPVEYWIWDGVQPTPAGHQLMADEWARVVRTFWRK